MRLLVLCTEWPQVLIDRRNWLPVLFQKTRKNQNYQAGIFILHLRGFMEVIKRWHKKKHYFQPINGLILNLPNDSLTLLLMNNLNFWLILCLLHSQDISQKLLLLAQVHERE